MLQLKIGSPFLIDAFDDMIIAIAERKNFHEYYVANYTRINELKRYTIDFYDEKENVIFSGIIDIWQESKKTYVEFEEL